MSSELALFTSNDSVTYVHALLFIKGYWVTLTGKQHVFANALPSGLCQFCGLCHLNIA